MASHRSALPKTAKETVNAAYALARLEKYGCDPTHTLVLCERDWGAKQVRELNAGFQAGFAGFKCKTEPIVTSGGVVRCRRHRRLAP